jgi:hypothetical protein
MAVLARPGREIDEHVQQLKKWGHELQPDVIIYQWYINDDEAPRSKLRGITELKHSELPEILVGLPLPLHIPLDRLPVRSLSHRRHIVPVRPKFSAPQHPFHGGLPSKDFPGCETLEYLHIRPGAIFGCALQSRWM